MMFVATNLTPSGMMTSRADLLGYTDAEILEINANAGSVTVPEPIAKRIMAVHNALQMAARALDSRLIEGRPH